MNNKNIHLHSMLVHSVLALSPLAAVAFILLKLQISIFSIGEPTWRMMLALSIIILFLLSLPATLSGIFERNHLYAKWHFTHKAKLILSLLFFVACLAELIMLIFKGTHWELFSIFGLLIIFMNNILSFFLNFFGLKITLGRQALQKTSYTPDLRKEEPVDILKQAGEYAKEEPKYIDLLEER